MIYTCHFEGNGSLSEMGAGHSPGIYSLPPDMTALESTINWINIINWNKSIYKSVILWIQLEEYGSYYFLNKDSM